MKIALISDPNVNKILSGRELFSPKFVKGKKITVYDENFLPLYAYPTGEKVVHHGCWRDIYRGSGEEFIILFKKTKMGYHNYAEEPDGTRG